MADTNKTVGIVIVAFLVVLLGVIFLAQTADQLLTTEKLVTTQQISLADARLRDDGANNINRSYTFHLTNGCPAAIGNWRAEFAGTNAAPGECGIEILTVWNSSGALAAGNYTAYAASTNCTGVGGLIGQQGELNFTNSTGIIAQESNITYVTYRYCGSSYQRGFSKTALLMVPGFFALAILCSIAFIIFWILRNEGVEIEI
jgi:hypothetical protein